VAQVLVRQLLHVRVGRAPLALAAGVDVARQLVDQLGPVDEQPALEHEEPGVLLVGEQHPDRLVLLDHRLQLAHRRRVVDDELRAHRHRELDHLPQVAGRAGEEGQAARRPPVEPSVHVGLDPAEVLVHRPVAVGALAPAPQHRLELLLDVLVADQPTSVHVQIARRDRCRLPSEPCEVPDGGFGEDGHNTSRSSGRCPDARSA
jgi:hypothetical protein